MFDRSDSNSAAMPWPRIAATARTGLLLARLAVPQHGIEIAVVTGCSSAPLYWRGRSQLITTMPRFTTQQIQQRQVFTRLWHGAFVSGDYQQYRVHPREYRPAWCG
jgi:hypothetical protein